MDAVRFGEALTTVYDLGIPLKKDDFLELTTEMYRTFSRAGALKSDGRWFYITPEVMRRKVRGAGDLVVVSESDKGYILKAVAYINKEAKKSVLPLKTFKERLLYAKKGLPKISKPDKDQPLAEVLQFPVGRIKRSGN